MSPILDTLEGYDAIRKDAAFVLVEDSIILFSGPDSESWLQGQVTADLRNLGQAGLLYCMTSPTGQLIADGAIWPFVDGLLLSCPASSAPAVLARVDEMVVMEEVSARVIASPVVSIQGPRAEAVAAAPSCQRLFHDRSGAGGFDLLLTPEEIPADARWAGNAALNIARLEAGIPWMGRDTTPKTLPPELGAAYEMAHISYTKGCYVGQEVLMRIHSRGRTNRRWVGLRAEGAMAEGEAVLVGGVNVGSLTSAAYSPSLGNIAAAMVRAEAANPGIARVGSQPARIVPMPMMPALAA